jgi:peptidoglycan/LPS O-acetylase OafA/YrhL
MNENVSPAAISIKPGINLEIEFLRAIAILMVIFLHLPVLFPGMNLGQWSGVDLFFCISGFVISRSFQQSFDRAVDEGRWKKAALAFWIRRLFRLAPSAWLWLAIMVTGAFVYNRAGRFGPSDGSGSLESAFYFLTFSTNFAFASGIMKTNEFLWSLTLEDQFYFVFPFFLLLFRGNWRWATLLLLIAVQAIPDRLYRTGDIPSLLWATRLDALMWGCLIYQFSRTALYRKMAPTFFRFPVVALAVSGLLIWCLIVIPKGTLGPWLGYRVESQVALVSAALVFLASYDRGYALPLAGPFKTVFAWIGARSYGLYLIHLPVFGIFTETVLRYSPLFGEHISQRYFYAIGFAALLTLFAELNFRYVETPMRDWGKRIADRILAKPELQPQAAE